MRFSGKTALVTGAAIAKRLASEGAHVVGLDILAFDSSEAEGGGRIEAMQADLADPSVSLRLARYFESKSLDALINNAGIGNSKSIDQTTDADWSRYMDINLSASFRMCRDLLPVLSKQLAKSS